MKKKAKRLFKVTPKSPFDRKPAKILQCILDENEQSIFDMWMDTLIFGEGMLKLSKNGKLEHIPYEKMLAFEVTKVNRKTKTITIKSIK